VLIVHSCAIKRPPLTKGRAVWGCLVRMLFHQTDPNLSHPVLIIWEYGAYHVKARRDAVAVPFPFLGGGIAIDHGGGFAFGPTDKRSSLFGCHSFIPLGMRSMDSLSIRSGFG
jgi:hypothetical protein